MIFKKRYYDWLYDAYAMEKLSLSIIETASSRFHSDSQIICGLHDLSERSRERQILLKIVIAHNGITACMAKAFFGKFSVLGHALDDLAKSEEMMKWMLSNQIIEHYILACYTSLKDEALIAEDKAGAAIFVNLLEKQKDLLNKNKKCLFDITHNFFCCSG